MMARDAPLISHLLRNFSMDLSISLSSGMSDIPLVSVSFSLTGIRPSPEDTLFAAFPLLPLNPEADAMIRAMAQNSAMAASIPFFIP